MCLHAAMVCNQTPNILWVVSWLAYWMSAASGCVQHKHLLLRLQAHYSAAAWLRNQNRRPQVPGVKSRTLTA